MKRKDFLINSFGILGALQMQTLLGNSFIDSVEAKRIRKFGLQLWSVRDALKKDFDGSIKLLAQAGYKLIESCDLGEGIFWGKKPNEFKKFLDDLGLQIKTSHYNMKNNIEQQIIDAASIGIEYLIYPWEGTNRTIDEYKKLAEDFNNYGAIAKKHGMKFAFHNHDYSFKKEQGTTGQDELLKGTDPNLVDFQMDMYWVVKAKEDPITWIKKYPNRFKLCHIKDMLKANNTDAETCILGTGQIDYKNILRQAQKLGMQYYIIELEHYSQAPSIEGAVQSAKWLKAYR